MHVVHEFPTMAGVLQEHPRRLLGRCPVLGRNDTGPGRVRRPLPDTLAACESAVNNSVNGGIMARMMELQKMRCSSKRYQYRDAKLTDVLQAPSGNVLVATEVCIDGVVAC